MARVLWTIASNRSLGDADGKTDECHRHPLQKATDVQFATRINDILALAGAERRREGRCPAPQSLTPASSESPVLEQPEAAADASVPPHRGSPARRD